jgi:pilus assembly protein FimV
MQVWTRLIGKIVTGFVATGLLLIPLYAHALGFGNIKIKSALNEPLDAEIELLSATDEEVKDLEVKLASREAFLRAGVDRSQQLSQIKFAVSKRGSKYFVFLKTPQSVREPFLNFLLEMNWQNGRMLREYTVLLDPPDRRATQVAEKAPEPTLPTVAPEPVTEPAAVAPQTTAPEPSPFLAPTPVQPEDKVAQATVPATPEPAAADQGAVATAPTPEAAAAPVEPKQADKKSKKKKSKKKTKQATEQDKAAVETPPLPSAEPAKAEEPTPAPTVATAEKDTSTPAAVATTANEGLFPNIPLNENSEVDVKALDASIKQSQQERKDEVVKQESPTTPAAVTPESAPPVTEATQTAQTTPAPESTTTPAPVPVTEGAATTGALDYGITRKGDNLWNIATKLKPNEEVTIYQVMMALQQNNPNAFVKGNIHRLRAGQVLRIEDPRVLTAMTKAQATKQYQTQTTEWQEYLASVGAQVPRQSIVVGDTGDKPQEGSSVTSGELTLTPPTSDAEGAGTGGSQKLAKKQDTEKLRAQVQKAVEEASSEKRKNTELSARLTDVEKELKRLENLVNIKDSDLASLQSKLEQLQKQRRETPKDDKKDIAAAPPKPAVVEPVPLETKTVQPIEQPTSPTELAAVTPPPAGVEAVPPGSALQPAQPPATDQTNVVPPVTAPAEKPPATSVEPVKAQKDGGFISNMLAMFTGLGGTVMYLIIGAVVLVLVMVLILILVRRRRNSVYFQESILKSGGAADSQLSPVMDATPSSPSSLMPGGESSFLSDFAISGVSAIQAEDSEVDPLTEADVFMAYGRYEAAEERLQEAIKQDPKRGELRVKLLELYTTTKNKKSFEATAEEYYAALGSSAGSNPLWQKVTTMGAEVAPNNPLFKGGSSGGTDFGFAHSTTLNDSKVMDIGIDTGAFSKSDFASPTRVKPIAPPRTEKTEDNLDFNLNYDTKAKKPAAPPSDDGLDFNLDFGGSAPATPASNNGGGLDFSIDMSTDDEPTATDLKFDMDNTSGLDFDLESGGSTKGKGKAASALDMNLDASDAINIDMPAGGNEVGTKLDLAKAYIDMGDPDGARSILDEVMSEGSDGQKQEARQLMQQIG